MLMCVLTQANQPDNHQSLLPLRLDPIQEMEAEEEEACKPLKLPSEFGMRAR